MSRELTPFSILWESPGPPGELTRREPPDYFPNLNLDQVFVAVAQARKDYDLLGFFRFPLESESGVRYRQDVFRDLDAGLEPAVEAFSSEMRRVRSHLTASNERHARYSAASWFLEGGQIYCSAVRVFERALADCKLASDGFGRCAGYLSEYVRSPAFEALSAETERLKQGLADVRYGVRVRGSRVFVLNCADEPDYSVEVLSTFEKFREREAEGRLVGFRHGFQNHIQEQIVELVARLYPDPFRSLLAYRQRFARFLDPVIAQFEQEVQFYLSYLAHVRPLKEAGLSFCYPALSATSKEVEATETFDLALGAKLVAEKRPVVCNDFHLAKGERIFVVSGPNQGGKTTFARMFGQLHHLAALGLPIPGKQARLFLCDRIFTHFEKQEQLEDLQGKLQEELIRVREIVRAATERSVVVMNESLASTTTQDSLFLGREVIGRLIALDALAVYVTFIDELSRVGPTVVSLVSTVDPANPAERTFKIVRRPADGRAYALAIAEKHGLTQESIKARLQR